MTSRHRIALATTLAMLVAAPAIGEPGRKDKRAMEGAEGRALEQYSNKEFAAALATADAALAANDDRAREEADAWDALAVRVRYMRAVSLRELERLAEAEAEFAALATQTDDEAVRGRAVAALEKLRAEQVSVRIMCPSGMYFRLYPAGAKAAERGNTYVCKGGVPTELTRSQGEYRVAWNYGYASDVRPVRLAPGPGVHLHLVEPPPPPKVPSGGGGCATGSPGG